MWPTTDIFVFVFHLALQGFCSTRSLIELEQVIKQHKVRFISFFFICFICFFRWKHLTRAEWSLVVLALRLHFGQALVQPDLNHNTLKEHLMCVTTVHTTTIQRDDCRPRTAWCNFMNPGTSGSCPFGPTISVTSNHIAQRGWNENVWLEDEQQQPPHPLV